MLRPKYAPILNGLVLATLFIPSVVLLVPLYLTILHPPCIGTSLLNNYLAVWLPAGRERVQHPAGQAVLRQPAARGVRGGATDGAGPFRVFWSIVLPMSRPILGVVSVFAIIAVAEGLPLAAARAPRPCRAAARRCGCRPSQSQTELDVFLAALAISTIIPVVLFLVFQRVFLRSAGLGGAVKG